MVRRHECVHGPELLPDAATLHARLDHAPLWPFAAMQTVPPGSPPGTHAVFPHAEYLLAGPLGTLTAPPLEPIYLRPVTITLPKPRP